MILSIFSIAILHGMMVNSKIPSSNMHSSLPLPCLKGSLPGASTAALLLTEKKVKRKRGGISLAAEHQTNSKVWLTPTWSPHTVHPDCRTHRRREQLLRAYNDPTCGKLGTIGLILEKDTVFSHNEAWAAAEPSHNNDLSESGIILAHKHG